MTEHESMIEGFLKDTDLVRENMNFLCGELIGSGSFRDVFQYQLDPNYVVKIQREKGMFNNIIEFEIWKLVMGSEYEKYFARCSWISDGGRIMLQRKTTPFTKRKPAPEVIPNFFTDIKDSNFGYIGKQLTAHDYDYSLVRFAYLALSNKTIKYKSHQ